MKMLGKTFQEVGLETTLLELIKWVESDYELVPLCVREALRAAYGAYAMRYGVDDANYDTAMERLADEAN
jgi:hypothetical protein